MLNGQRLLYISSVLQSSQWPTLLITQEAAWALAVCRCRREQLHCVIGKADKDLHAVRVKVDEVAVDACPRPVLHDQCRIPLRCALLVQVGGHHSAPDERRAVGWLPGR